MHQTALAWLRPLVGRPDESIIPTGVTLRRHRRVLRDVLGKWPQDVLRHTAASYLLALHKDAARVAMWLGNSVRILEMSYKTPVAEADVKTFWNLTPKAVKTGRTP